MASRAKSRSPTASCGANTDSLGEHGLAGYLSAYHELRWGLVRVRVRVRGCGRVDRRARSGARVAGRACRGAWQE